MVLNVGPFRLAADSNGIAPRTEALTIQIGTFSTTIPAGSLKLKNGEFTFAGVIDVVELYAQLNLVKGKSYELRARMPIARL